MFPNRRAFLAMTGASLSFATLPAGPASASSATRQYAVYLGRKKVGDSTVRLSRSGGRVDAEVNVTLHLNILGLVRFDYRLSNRESWRDGVLQELRSTTDNNGKAEQVSANRTGRGLEIDGSSYQGVLSGNPATTSYFTPDFLTRSTWLNTQNGKVFTPTIRQIGNTGFTTNEGSLLCSRYSVRGGVDTDLYYDSNNEWMGSSFAVVGRTARIAMSNRGGSLNQIWVG